MKNILLLLIPKHELAYLDDSMSIRQALEKMKAHSYTAIPLISKTSGEYLGTISEGDLLYEIIKGNEYDIKDLEEKKIASILRKDYVRAVKVDQSTEDLIGMIMNQNFVPVVDDRNILMGIVTRKAIITEFIKQQ